MMIRYMKSHEDHIRAMLAADVPDCDWKELQRLHGIRIRRMQHERLIHLLLLLEIPYLIYYFRLENGVQQWYHLTDEIDLRFGGDSMRKGESGTDR
jgi:hypothetical protein